MIMGHSDDPRYVPVYTPAFAAKLVDLHHQQVRSWLGTMPSADRPVVARGKDARKPLVTFLDVVELVMLHRLVEHYGFKVRDLREAIHEASEELGIDHPLARRQLYADGHTLAIRVGDGRRAIRTLRTGGQYGLPEILESRLRVIDFDEYDLAIRWWPQGHQGGVVVDPSVAFGAPTVPNTGIDTEALHSLWLAEGRDTDRVAWAYDLERDQVERAVHWHDQHFGQRRAA